MRITRFLKFYCTIKQDKRNLPLNNYNPDGWQLRVYEPIPLSNVELIQDGEQN